MEKLGLGSSLALMAMVLLREEGKKAVVLKASAREPAVAGRSTAPWKKVPPGRSDRQDRGMEGKCMGRHKKATSKTTSRTELKLLTELRHTRAATEQQVWEAPRQKRFVVQGG